MSIPRNDVAPVWTRSFPIGKEPKTLGQHLKKKRFTDGLRQKEAAAKLGVCSRTLSLWECDRLCPSWDNWPCIIEYLDFDPFTNPDLETPKGNEPFGVAFLASEAVATIGQKLKRFRLKSRKTRKQMALELGLSVKTLWGWETDRWQPSAQGRDKIEKPLESAVNKLRL